MGAGKPQQGSPPVLLLQHDPVPPHRPCLRHSGHGGHHEHLPPSCGWMIRAPSRLTARSGARRRQGDHRERHGAARSGRPGLRPALLRLPLPVPEGRRPAHHGAGGALPHLKGKIRLCDIGTIIGSHSGPRHGGRVLPGRRAPHYGLTPYPPSAVHGKPCTASFSPPLSILPNAPPHLCRIPNKTAIFSLQKGIAMIGFV